MQYNPLDFPTRFVQFAVIMYAVIETGGKQYKVSAGDILEIEKIEGDAGAAIQFDKILLAAEPAEGGSKIWLGKPFLEKAKIQGEVIAQGRGDKILIMKFKRRKNYHRKQGHRQNLTHVLVTEIDNGAGQVAKLSDSDKKAKLSRFSSQLTPKGPASTVKTLGSRKKMKEASAEKSAS